MKVTAKIPLYRLIPSMITLAALCIGVSAIRYGLDAKWQIAVTLILIAAVLDGLDGRVARLINATSSFGAYLDSIADMVAFGVAPAMVNYFWLLHTIPYKGVGWAIVLVFISCGAIRLARFNALQDKDDSKSNAYFVGVPIPLAAILSLVPLMFTFELSPYLIVSSWALSLYMIVISLLMISRIHIDSFKNISMPREWVPLMLALLAMALASVIIEPWLVLPAAFTVYGLLIIILGMWRYRQL